MAVDAEAILRIGAKWAGEPGTCLYYSGGSLDSAQISWLGILPKDEVRVAPSSMDPWQELERALHLSGRGSQPEWMGYLAYEMGAWSDRYLDLQRPSTPLAQFYKPSVVVSYNHQTGELSSDTLEQASLPAACAGRSEILADLEPIEAYADKVREIQELIREGEVYQVNLSQKMLIASSMDPYALFCHLLRLNPAPFMAYLNCGDHVVISSSPERFLRKRQSRLETRPIKGTIQRGTSPEEDLALRRKLLRSEKDRAELLMITDLMRNDLGRMSEPGSVIVSELCRCEAYENVFHLLSVIESQVKSKYSPLDILKLTFPAGSITGCPKRRAMEVIGKIEQRARGLYTGSIGYLTGRGDFDFSVAIRTLVGTGDVYDIQLGGAVVIDSDPYLEYEETLHKGASIFQALGGLPCATPG